MSDYDNSNRGFARDYADPKRKPGWPSEKGVLNIDGIDLWLSTWIKLDKNGNEFRSIQATPMTDPAHNRRNFQGVMFKVRQPDGEKSPTWEGNMELENGEKVSLVGWEKTFKEEQWPGISIAVNEYKEPVRKPKKLTSLTAPEPEAPAPAPVAAPAQDDFEDDIPW